MIWVFRADVEQTLDQHGKLLKVSTSNESDSRCVRPTEGPISQPVLLNGLTRPTGGQTSPLKIEINFSMLTAPKLQVTVITFQDGCR